MMIRKQIELPPGVARTFVRDMKAFFKEENSIKRDEIAARQLWVLQQHQEPREKKLRITDVYEMFKQMRDQA